MAPPAKQKTSLATSARNYLSRSFGISAESAPTGASAASPARSSGGTMSVDASAKGIARGIERSNQLLGNVAVAVSMSNSYLAQQVALQSRTNTLLSGMTTVLGSMSMSSIAGLGGAVLGGAAAGLSGAALFDWLGKDKNTPSDNSKLKTNNNTSPKSNTTPVTQTPYNPGNAPKKLPTSFGPGNTGSRQGRDEHGQHVAITRLHPEFRSKLEAAIKEAKEAGLNPSIHSAYRPPGLGVGGFGDKFKSLHAYGAAVDMSGIGRPGSRQSKQWYEIANRHGLYNPYGPNHKKEWNHYQLVPRTSIPRGHSARDTITSAGPKNLEQMWNAIKPLERSPDMPARGAIETGAPAPPALASAMEKAFPTSDANRSTSPSTDSRTPSTPDSRTPSTPDSRTPSTPNVSGNREANVTRGRSRGSASEAMSFFMSKGWTKAQAAGIVGNLEAESNLNPHGPRGDGGKAYGIAQWHAPRRAIFKREFGKDITQSTFREQLEFVHWELMNTEKNAGNRLRKASSAQEAAVIVDQFYERSAGRHRQRRINNALRLAGEKYDATQSDSRTSGATTGGNERTTSGRNYRTRGGTRTPQNIGNTMSGGGGITKQQVQAAWEKLNDPDGPPGGSNADFFRADALMRRWQAQGGDKVSPIKDSTNRRVKPVQPSGKPKVTKPTAPLPPVRPIDGFEREDQDDGRLMKEAEKEANAKSITNEYNQPNYIKKMKEIYGGGKSENLYADPTSISTEVGSTAPPLPIDQTRAVIPPVVQPSTAPPIEPSQASYQPNQEQPGYSGSSQTQIAALSSFFNSPTELLPGHFGLNPKKPGNGDHIPGNFGIA